MVDDVIINANRFVSLYALFKLKNNDNRNLYLFLLFQPDKDLIISGQVTHVGKTSLEITLWLDQINDDKLVRITRAHFVFVARDPTNTSSVMVNNLMPVGEREKNLMILSASKCIIIEYDIISACMYNLCK